MAHLGGAKSDSARIQIAALEQALDHFFLDLGRYPTTEEGLNALISWPSDKRRWSGPYLSKQAVPVDPWERPYVYRAPGSNSPYDLYTLGADNRPGGTGEDAAIGRGGS